MIALRATVPLPSAPLAAKGTSATGQSCQIWHPLPALGWGRTQRMRSRKGEGWAGRTTGLRAQWSGTRASLSLGSGRRGMGYSTSLQLRRLGAQLTCRWLLQVLHLPQLPKSCLLQGKRFPVTSLSFFCSTSLCKDGLVCACDIGRARNVCVWETETEKPINISLFLEGLNVEEYPGRRTHSHFFLWTILKHHFLLGSCVSTDSLPLFFPRD